MSIATTSSPHRATVQQPGLRPVFAAAVDAASDGESAALAVVLETEGSTYVSTGAMALFGAAVGQVGWLSGGCLEPEIAHVALQAARDGRIAWMEVDTRDDEDLLAGSALGCRGRLRIALLPLRALVGIDAMLSAWEAGGVELELTIAGDGTVVCGAVDAGSGDRARESDGNDRPARRWHLEGASPGWCPSDHGWALRIAAPPEVRVFGAGPETPLLLPLLRELGWRTTLAERRARWVGHAAHADRHLDASPASAAQGLYRAALVMHHNFELDREALDALAGTAIPFVGLLGPVRRREDLFQVLPASHREALAGRLRSPVGMKLGGQGPEAIALSIAAQLQAWRYGETAASESMPTHRA